MNRIEAIASLVDNDALVVDIGTDHAYLPIYLYENDITKNIVASDISSNALLFAKNNLEKHNLRGKIKLVVSDGFKNLDECFDIAIISGVGTETIKKILDNEVLPNKLILSSHKNVSDLREYMFKIGYKIEKEIIKKLTIAVMKFPYLIETSPTVNIILEKSIFPVIMEIQGIIISSTREETIFWNAAPITTPIAKSITFPFIANCLNSFNI